MRELDKTALLVPAAHVYLKRRGQVLLQQRRATGYLDGFWVASAAGHIERAETARACAVRELAEELGVHVRQQDLELLTVMQRTDGSDNLREQRVDWFFEVSAWQGNPTICEPSKCSGLSWFDFADLPSPMPDYEIAILSLAVDGKVPLVSSYGFGSASHDVSLGATALDL